MPFFTFSESDPAILLHMKPAEGGNREVLDITGMFHWCPSRSLDECLLVSIYVVKH